MASITGDRTTSGVTAAVPPGALDTVHWRHDLGTSTSDELGGLWVGAVTSTHIEVRGGAGGQWVERATGDVTAPPDDVIDQEPPQYGVETGRLVEVADDGTIQVLGAVRGELPTTRLPGHAEPLGDGWVVAFEGDMVALDEDLRIRWTHRLQRPAGMIGTTADVVVLGGRRGVTALDRATGEIVWEEGSEQAPGPWSPEPRLEGDVVLLADVQQVRGVDAATGATRWSVPAIQSQWAWSDGRLAMAIGTSPHGYLDLVTVDIGSGEVRHEGEVVLPGDGRLGGTVGPPLVTDDGLVVALEAPDGIAKLSPDGTVPWHVPDRTVHLEGDRNSRLIEDPATGEPAVVESDLDGTIRIVALPSEEVVFETRRDPPPPIRNVALTGNGLAVADGAVAIDLLTDGGDRRQRLVDLATGETLTDLRSNRVLRGTAGGFVALGWNAGVDDPFTVPGVALMDALGALRWEGEADSRADQVLATVGGRVLVSYHRDTYQLQLIDLDRGRAVGAPLAIDGRPSPGTIGPGGLVTVARSPADRRPPDETGTGPEPVHVALDLTSDGPARRWLRPVTGTLVGDDDHLVEVGRFTIQVVDPEDGTTLATHVLDHPSWWGPAFRDGHVVVVSDRHVSAIDVTTGETAWTHALGTEPSAAPIIAGDEVLLGLADGTVRRLSLGDGTDRGRVTIGSSPVRDVAVVHGVLLARDHGAVVLVGPAELPDALRREADRSDRQAPGDEVKVPAP